MPTEFQETLLALRDRYLALATTTAQQASHAREQLNHINALLVDQAILSEGTEIAPLPELSPTPSLLPALSPSPAANISDEPAPAAEQASAPPTTPAPFQRRKPTQTAIPKAIATKASPAPQNGKPERATVLSLLPAFAGLSKTEAVAQVMADHAGQAVSLDQIIELLHGEMDLSDLKQERKRMRTIMWRGVDSKKWQRVKGKDSHYILPTKLLPASNGRASGKPQPAATAKPAITGSLMGSVEKVLRDNQGTPMRAEAIATAIYGDLAPARLAEVKKEVSDRLAKGAKAKRWQRVPQQLGVYVYS
jgi:hypothetical protein